MPVPDPNVIQRTQLGLRFIEDDRYTRERLFRDLRDYVVAVDERFAILESIIADQEARLIAGGL